MLFLYNLGIFFYQLFIRISALWNAKAKLWVEGRKAIFAQLKKQLDPQRPVIWMHCASLGEFEQGRPLLEAIRTQYPRHQLLLSFFSPSGYEIRKKFPGADLVCYLPADTAANARHWVDLVKPQLSIFVKYEYWHHYIFQLQQAKCPVILVSAIFRPQEIFFKFYGRFFKKILQRFEHIFVQDEASADLLSKQGLQNFSIAGDTRIDRVLSIAAEGKSFSLIAAFCSDSPVIICGSSWPAEENILAKYLQKNPATPWKFIIAPHEITEVRLQQLEAQLPLPALRYSQAKSPFPDDLKVLIIDNIGMLSALYRYGKVAFIGGAFGHGLHNILEPIAFGLPVVFGPKYHKFSEAVTLCNTGGAFAVNDETEFSQVLQQLQQAEFYASAKKETQTYLESNKGATEKVMGFINTLLTTISPAEKSKNEIEKS